MLHVRFLILLAPLAGSLSAQRVLLPFGETTVPGFANAVTAGATRCDSHGDIYLRIASVPEVSHQLLVRIGRYGSMATFNPEKVTDSKIQDWLFQDFAVTSDAVWILAPISSRARSENYVLKFNLQGDYQGAIQFEGGFFPNQLAVFDTGDFLVSGVEQVGHGSDERQQAVTAMFDKQGKLLKRIQREDESTQNQKPANDSNDMEVSSEITLGTAESYGGEIYVLRASARCSIMVISAGGTVARRFVLEPPAPEARAARIRVMQGQIAVEFVRSKPGAEPRKKGEPVVYYNSLAEYLVYDAFTGDKVGDYTRDPGLSGAFVCFDGRGGFEFLDQTESGTRKIIRAGAR